MYDKDKRLQEIKGEEDRDNKGHWLPGVSGNPKGRPRREVEQAYTSVTIESVSLQDWNEIVSRAVQDAKKGDAQARQFLANYIVGKPIDRVAVVDENEEMNVELSFGNPTVDFDINARRQAMLSDGLEQEDNDDEDN